MTGTSSPHIHTHTHTHMLAFVSDASHTILCIDKSMLFNFYSLPPAQSYPKMIYIFGVNTRHINVIDDIIKETPKVYTGFTV